MSALYFRCKFFWVIYFQFIFLLCKTIFWRHYVTHSSLFIFRCFFLGVWLVVVYNFPIQLNWKLRHIAFNSSISLVFHVEVEHGKVKFFTNIYSIIIRWDTYYVIIFTSFVFSFFLSSCIVKDHLGLVIG